MSVKVSLVRSQDGTFTIDLGSKALPKISFNPLELEPEVRQEEHMGARLLLAAALSCYVNTMAGDMSRMGVEAPARDPLPGGDRKGEGLQPKDPLHPHRD